jgi:hypothetical protein
MESDNFLQNIELENPATKPQRLKRAVDFCPTKKHVKTNKNTSVKSKKGGYRPILVSKEALEAEAVDLRDKMSLLRELYSTRRVSDQDLVVLYLIMYLNTRYPDDFLENFNPILASVEETNLIRTSASLESFVTLKNNDFNYKLAKFQSRSLFEIINNFNLHSVPHSARFAITNW